MNTNEASEEENTRAREVREGEREKGSQRGLEREGESENDRHAKRGSPSPDGNLMVAL